MIKSIKIEIKGQEIELTMVEAKKLYADLQELFPKPREVDISKYEKWPQIKPDKHWLEDMKPNVVG